MSSSIPDVGDQDPTQHNSPIASEADEETQFLVQDESGDAACYFNDVIYAHDSFVKSGTVVLRCDCGVWIEAGPADADNP